jgi:cell wall-associated NlpC family hydrolase
MKTSGLRSLRRLKARKLATNAAKLSLANAPVVHYSQGVDRWEGIDKKLKAYKGQYPKNTDCSASATWWIWNGLSHFGKRDVVNGQRWEAGYTGTMVNHGIRVKHRINYRRGDLVLYGDPYGSSGHVAMYVGRGKVISHGSEGGPYLVPWNYRSDVHSVRRYI